MKKHQTNSERVEQMSKLEQAVLKVQEELCDYREYTLKRFSKEDIFDMNYEIFVKAETADQMQTIQKGELSDRQLDEIIGCSDFLNKVFDTFRKNSGTVSVRDCIFDSADGLVQWSEKPEQEYVQ